MNKEKWKISYSIDYWSSIDKDWCCYWTGFGLDKASAKFEEFISKEEDYTFRRDVRFRTNYEKICDTI